RGEDRHRPRGDKTAQSAVAVRTALRQSLGRQIRFRRLSAPAQGRAEARRPRRLRRPKAEAAKRGKLRGFGFGYYVEITGAAGQEPAAIKFTDNGGVELYCGTQSNG